jgi:Protein of unknown function (DUF4079)
MDKQLIPYLKLVHGSFNTLVMFLFLYQGRLGLKIRGQRKHGKSPAIFKVVKKHRRFGPILFFLGFIGFLAGLTLAVFDHGRVFEYPLHLIMGLLIVLLLITTFLISKEIRGSDSPWRTPHFMVGIFIISFYIIQIFIGLGVLL